MLEIVIDRREPISISEISEISCITPEDIIGTLQYLGIVKYYKGQNSICITPEIEARHRKVSTDARRPPAPRLAEHAARPLASGRFASTPTAFGGPRSTGPSAATGDVRSPPFWLHSWLYMNESSRPPPPNPPTPSSLL